MILRIYLDKKDQDEINKFSENGKYDVMVRVDTSIMNVSFHREGELI